MMTCTSPVAGSCAWNPLQKLEELLVPMTPMAMPITFPVATSNAANSEVVPCRCHHGFAAPGSPDASPARAACDRTLPLALFIQAENQRVVGRIEIEADNIADLFDKLRVSRQLKCLQPVRLQAERTPDARDGGLRHADDLTHRASRALGGMGRGRLQGAGDDVHDAVVGHGPGSRRAAVHGQAKPCSRFNAEPLAPFPHAVARHAQVPRHDLVGVTRGAGQHHPGPKRQPLGGLRAARPLLQRPLLPHPSVPAAFWGVGSHGGQHTKRSTIFNH